MEILRTLGYIHVILFKCLVQQKVKCLSEVEIIIAIDLWSCCLFLAILITLSKQTSLETWLELAKILKRQQTDMFWWIKRRSTSPKLLPHAVQFLVQSKRYGRVASQFLSYLGSCTVMVWVQFCAISIVSIGGKAKCYIHWFWMGIKKSQLKRNPFQYRCVSAKKTKHQCVSSRVTSFFHQPINLRIFIFTMENPTMDGFHIQTGPR